MNLKAMVLAALVATTDRAAFAQAVEVRLSPAAQSVAAGNTVAVQVRVDTNGLPVGNGGLFLKYDRTRLAFESGTNDTTIWNNGLATGLPDEIRPGVLAWSVGATGPVTAQDVPVSTLTFRAKSSLGDARLEWMNTAGTSETSFADLEFTQFPTTLTDATVTVVEARPHTPTSTPTATQTATHTGTQTGTHTATHTATATSTPSRTPTASFTATPTPPPCPGDCDRNGFVAVDELVRAAHVLLRVSPAEVCSALDRDQDGVGSIDEAVRAYQAALDGCP